MPGHDVNADSMPRRQLGVRIRRFRGTLHLALAENSYELSSSAADIFAWIDGSSTIHAIGERLADAYGIPLEESVSDVIEFVSWLVERQLAEIVPADRAPTR